MPTKRRPLDFSTVKELISLEQALRSLGWRPSGRAGGQLRGPCPIHGSHDSSSRSLAVGGQVYYCHRCKAAGNVLQLWALVKRLTLLEAAYDLCSEFGVPPPYIGR